MRFRYLTVLILVAGLASSAELLAQSRDSQIGESHVGESQVSEGQAAQPSNDQPQSTLGAALEPHKDADDVIQETDRQFEEAKRELEQRFREVEKESPVKPSSGAQDIDDILKPSSDPKVRAALEETERRFEEASRQIESSFKEAERDVPVEIRDSRTSAQGKDKAKSE
ncbi:MAG: hypothetical protein ACTH3D_10560 [Halomonas sp.]|uniref:hypothetical protein n=1 Tax=Halomonas sp. TaxID=1486246 RepID=UPI003F9266F1